MGASLKSQGYPGFHAVTGSIHSGDASTPASGSGIFMWSGSKQLYGDIDDPAAGKTDYFGVGLEAVGNSESYFRFRTKTGSTAGAGSELDIRTDTFFLGSSETFISGSGDGTIAISSSNFELTTGGDVTLQGTITVENSGDFADVNSHMSGSSFYENFQATLDTTKWTTGNLNQTLKTTTPDSTPYLGMMFNNSAGSNGFTAGAIGNTTFLRSEAPVMEVDVVVNETNAGTFFGFVPAETEQSDITDTNADQYNFNHLMEGVYFQAGNIRVYSDHDNSGLEGGNEQGSNAMGTGTWMPYQDTFFRLRITLKPAGGARYEVYKNGDFTTPFSSYDTTGNTRQQLKPAFFLYYASSVSEQLTIGQMGVGAANQIQSTRISGNSISTGKIQSSNFGELEGSEFKLDDGTFKLGGSSLPKLEWDGTLLSIDGTITANAGTIGGWNISSTQLSKTGLIINSSTTYIKVGTNGTEASPNTNIRLTGGDNGKFELRRWTNPRVTIDDNFITGGESPAGIDWGGVLINDGLLMIDNFGGNLGATRAGVNVSFRNLVYGGEGSQKSGMYIGMSEDEGSNIENANSIFAINPQVGSTTGLGVHNKTTGNCVGIISQVDEQSGSPFAASITFLGIGGVLANDGNINCQAEVIAYSSDKRLKENISPIENPLEKIKKLRGVYFDWKDNLKETVGFEPDKDWAKNEIGMIAQELEEVIPQAVCRAPFDISYGNKVLYKNGERTDGETEPYKTIKMEKIVPLLIESVKEQQKQIELLTKKIEALESK